MGEQHTKDGVDGPRPGLRVLLGGAGRKIRDEVVALGGLGEHTPFGRRGIDHHTLGPLGADVEADEERLRTVV